MDYLDEVIRMRRMFDDLEVRGRLRRDIDPVSKMISPSVPALGPDLAKLVPNTDVASQFNEIAKTMQREMDLNLKMSSSLELDLDKVATQGIAKKRQGEMELIGGQYSQLLQPAAELGKPVFNARMLAIQLQEQLAGPANYLDSPHYKMLQSIEKKIRQSESSIQFAFRDSVVELKKLPDYNNWAQIMTEASQSLISSYNLALDLGVDRFAEELRETTDWLRHIQVAASPVLNVFANELLANTISGSLNPSLVEGFGADLLNHLSRVEAVESEEEMSGVLQEFFTWLIEQAKRLPATAINFKALMAIFNVVLFLYGQYGDKQAEQRIKGEVATSEERVLERIDELEAKITVEIDGKKLQDTQRKEYVVMNSANLRNGPGTDYEPLRVLPPNLIVEEIGSDGEWIHVEFFDYIKGETEQGWISTELLTKKPGDE